MQLFIEEQQMRPLVSLCVKHQQQHQQQQYHLT